MAEFVGPFICPSLHRLGMLLRAAYILRNKCLADDTDIKAIGESDEAEARKDARHLHAGRPL